MKLLCLSLSGNISKMHYSVKKQSAEQHVISIKESI